MSYGVSTRTEYLSLLKGSNELLVFIFCYRDTGYAFHLWHVQQI